MATISRGKSATIKKLSINGWHAEISYVEPVTESGESLPSYYSWWAIKGEWEDDHHDFARHDTAEAAEASLQSWFVAHDMGSLDPLDIGFDLRLQEMPVAVPQTGFLRVRMPRSKKHPEGRVVEGRRWLIVQSLRAAGFKVAS